MATTKQPEPLPPPLPVGTRVRYVGPAINWQGEGVVVRLVKGRRGTGRKIGEDVYDTTDHGRSIARIRIANGDHKELAIRAESEWANSYEVLS